MNEIRSGDVVVITTGCYTGRIGLVGDETYGSSCNRSVHLVTRDGVVEDLAYGQSGLRRVVVIDPEDREAVQHLANLFGTQPDCLANYGFDAMRAALREFADPTPPKPDEPTGLGAVVLDANGNRWVRVYGPAAIVNYDCWKMEHQQSRHGWSKVEAVEVLNDGWTG